MTFCPFQITNTYLATSNITEIKRPASGGKFSPPPPVVTFDIDSELTEMWGGNWGGFLEGN